RSPSSRPTSTCHREAPPGSTRPPPATARSRTRPAEADPCRPTPPRSTPGPRGQGELNPGPVSYLPASHEQEPTEVMVLSLASILGCADRSATWHDHHFAVQPCCGCRSPLAPLDGVRRVQRQQEYAQLRDTS